MASLRRASSSDFECSKEASVDIVIGSEICGRKQSVFSCILGFGDEKGTFSKVVFVCSALSVLPIIGGITGVISCVGKGAANYIENPENAFNKRLCCFILSSLRIVLSCLGLGFFFFLLDILYTLGCCITNKFSGN